MQGQGGARARFVPHGGTRRPVREGFSSSRATMRPSSSPCLSSGSMKPERAVKKLKDDVLGVYPCIPLAFSDDCEAYGRGISECLLQTFLALNMVTRVLTYNKLYMSLFSWQSACAIRSNLFIALSNIVSLSNRVWLYLQHAI